MSRKEVYQAVHIVGVALVAGMTEILSEPDPITWRGWLKAIIAGMTAGGLYWAKPPGVTVVPTAEHTDVQR